MDRFITTLAELSEQSPKHLVLLYSGGVDGSFLLQWLRQRDVAVTALNVRLDTESDTYSHLPADLAEKFGADFREIDAIAEFFAEFVPPAIHADAYYQGQFPVGSTLTRPLMARLAVVLARELEADAIAHTATYMQNSALRLSGSIAALAPDLRIAAPFLGSDLPREEKLRRLGAAGVEFNTGVHSIDANPWSRVIECGSLENPENILDESVFTWTVGPAERPAEAVEIDLGFECGLPTGLDGEPLGLSAIVLRLNKLAGRHGIGRFSGLEDTPFGVKNHEVRESPAAAVITSAHRALGNAVYGAREHSLRAFLSTEWTSAAVRGAWFTDVTQAVARCIAELDLPLTGTVRLRLHQGAVTVLRLSSPNGLYHARFGERFHELMRNYSYSPWLTLSTLADRVRIGGALS
jgi:argininosuccinate synthase